MKHYKSAVGAVGLSFDANADLIFIETEDLKLINRLSSLRPKAYICVFTENPRVKNLTALNFGVYCFPKSFKENPENFIGTFGSQFIAAGKKEACILHLETNKDNNIVNHRVSHHKN